MAPHVTWIKDPAAVLPVLTPRRSRCPVRAAPAPGPALRRRARAGARHLSPDGRLLALTADADPAGTFANAFLQRPRHG
ncbi:hypothetical protein [Streptomyces sp.]|uniref:hypothetical protein n=1 Tax=Streptomyces sp. TaxID=1931 RepID=UPI002F41F7E9